MFVEAGGLPYRLGQIFCEVADVAAGFFGATEDAFDVYLRPEVDDVRGFGGRHRPVARWVAELRCRGW